MIALYQLVFYRPILNVLIALYNNIPGHDMGVAILLLTIAVRLLLLPLTSQMLKSQKAMQNLQPKIKALQEQYKNEKDKLSKELMGLYKTEKVNPLSSCLPLLIQLPIFIALYQALGAGIGGSGLHLLYSFVSRPENINPLGFGFIPLAKANIVLALLAGVSQWFQARQLTKLSPTKGIPGAKDEAMLSAMNKQMQYLMPVFTVFIGWKLPAGLVLYWLLTNVLTVVQQYFFLRKTAPPVTPGTVTINSPPPTSPVSS